MPTPPLAFTGTTPCRIADTRGNGFTGAYGPPALTQSSPRNFTLTGQCGIPGTAQAVSLNITVTNTQGPGFILIYPQGGAQPTVSTLNYVANETIANTAVVPLGTGGGVTVIAGVSGTNLIIDTNGYYAPQTVVNTVNGLSGAVTLAPGSNVSITPSGQTLTIASNGGPGGLLPTGTSGQTLRHNGTSWVANSVLTNDGSSVTINGTIKTPGSIRVESLGQIFLHNPGVSNTFLGDAAGNPAITGFGNTGIGREALHSNSSGNTNTGVGYGALDFNTVGGNNTALGFFALLNSVSGSGNTAVGTEALRYNTIGASNTAAGLNALQHNVDGSTNTAVGAGALFSLLSGSENTAIGSSALNNVEGSGNIAIGSNAGANLAAGNNKIYIGNEGAGPELNTIRIGSGAFNHERFFVAAVRGVTTDVANAIPVLISSAGQLGTISSSARVKEEIADMGEASDGLLKLRPVTFRYRGQTGDRRQFGLVGEEVERVLPDLVVHDPTGAVETVLYHELPAMLVNEIQKQQRRIEKQEQEIQQLRELLGALSARQLKAERSLVPESPERP